jgi:hypothetical protein
MALIASIKSVGSEVIYMTENTKRAIAWLVFAVGVILGIIGWADVAYSSWTGTIIFLVFAVVSIALRILWDLGRRGR